jgi:xanthosine utilization system XapX-like protein
MKIYLLSLGAGLLVGIVYSLLNVRSPAPPVIALGWPARHSRRRADRAACKDHLEQASQQALSWLHQVKPHMFGHLPKGGES